MRVLRGLLAIAVSLAILLVAGVMVPRPLFEGSATDDLPRSRPILLVANAIHTDIAIPLDTDLRARFGFLGEAGLPVDHEGAAYILFGWGGREFFLNTPEWKDLRPWPVLRALTVDRSVLHVDFAGPGLADAPMVEPLLISDAGRHRLIKAILASFARADGVPQIIPDIRYGRYDGFYEAEGAFNLVLGCNTWTARMLREAGLTTGFWTPLPQSLSASLAFHD